MTCTNYIRTADELVAIYERATSERGYVSETFTAIPAGHDHTGCRLTLVTWEWQLPSLELP